MPKDDNITGFTRDPTLGATVADQFGGGAARAEELINAWHLRESEELRSANLLVEDVEARGEFSTEDAEKAADLPKGSIKGVTKRGQYLVYAFVGPDGRSGKDALVIEDGKKLVQPEGSDSPEKAALRASVAASRKITEAQSEADQILEKARAEAAELIQKAAQEGEKVRSQEAKKAAKAQQESSDDGEDLPPVNQADSGVRTPQRKPSQAGAPKGDKK